jgi:hypothetical protein
MEIRRKSRVVRWAPNPPYSQSSQPGMPFSPRVTIASDQDLDKEQAEVFPDRKMGVSWRTLRCRSLQRVNHTIMRLGTEFRS